MLLFSRFGGEDSEYVVRVLLTWSLHWLKGDLRRWILRVRSVDDQARRRGKVRYEGDGGGGVGVNSGY